MCVRQWWIERKSPLLIERLQSIIECLQSSIFVSSQCQRGIGVGQHSRKLSCSSGIRRCIRQSVIKRERAFFIEGQQRCFFITCEHQRGRGGAPSFQLGFGCSSSQRIPFDFVELESTLFIEGAQSGFFACVKNEGRVVPVHDSLERGVIMQAAPAPIGLVFTGLCGLQRGLCILDLVLRTGFLGEFHVCPDRAQELFDRAGIDDRAVIAVDDTPGRHIDGNILNRQEGATLGGSTINPVDPQIPRNFADMCGCHSLNRKVIFRSHASRVDLEDIAGRPHRATRRDQRDIRPDHRGRDQQVGRENVVLRRQFDRAAIAGHAVLGFHQPHRQIALGLRDIDLAACGAGIKPRIRNLAEIDRQRDRIGTDPPACGKRDNLATNGRSGGFFFRSKINLGRQAGLGGDVALRGQGGGAEIVANLTVHKNAGGARIHIHLASRVVEEIDLDHPVSGDRMRMGGEAPDRALVLVGIGFLAVPGRAHVIVGLLPGRGIGDHHVAGIGIKIVPAFGDIGKLITGQDDIAG